MSILPGIIKSLFNFEDSPFRFEKVCIDLYRKAEGVELVPTSTSWDLGIDARTISVLFKGRELGAVLCATLSADVDEKVERDIRRVVEKITPKRIVYCSSRPLSEHRCDRIEANIRTLAPSADSVVVLGQIQLVELGQRYQEVLQKHYAAEIHTIEQEVPSQGV